MSFQISDTLIDLANNDSLLDVSASTINQRVSSSIVPSTTNTYNLGSSGSPFNTIYLSSNSLIIGKIALSSVNNSLNIGTVDQNVSLVIPSGIIAIQESIISTNSEGNLALPTSTMIGNVLPGTINILNIFSDTSMLPSDALLGNAYMISLNTSVAGDLYVCTDTTLSPPNNFTNIGPIQGVQGVQGPVGNQGPAGTEGGLFTLIPTPISVSNAVTISSNQISSAVGVGPPTVLWNGRAQSLNLYQNSPCYVSFTIPNGVTGSTPPTGGVPYCAIGISSSPASGSTSDYGYFQAAFLIQQNIFQITVNNLTTPFTPSTNTWTNASVFTIIFDGYFFNFFITNQSTTPDNIQKQVFSYPVTLSLNFYFTASFASGLNGYSALFPVANIIFAPYALLNSRNYFGNTINNYMWAMQPSSDYPIMSVNNSYVFTKINQVMSSSNSYGSGYNNGTFSTPLEGFVFSFVLPETYGSNINIYINGRASQGNPNYDVMKFVVNNYNCSINAIVGSGTVRQLGTVSYNIGDVCSVYFNPAITLANLYIYLNQTIVYTIPNFYPGKPCQINIQTDTDGNIPANPIRLVNPLFYQYGNLALHL